MEVKNKKVLGIALVAIGGAFTVFQWFMMQRSGSFFAIGGISTALAVVGLAILLFKVDLSDAQITNEDGSKSNMGFMDMPTPMKVTIVVAVLAMIAHFLFFKYA